MQQYCKMVPTGSSFCYCLIVLLYGHSKRFPLDLYFPEAINNSNLKKSPIDLYFGAGDESKWPLSMGSFQSGIKWSCFVNVKGHQEQIKGNFILERRNNMAMHTRETLQSGWDWNRNRLFLYDALVGWDCNRDIGRSAPYVYLQIRMISPLQLL